MWKGTQIQDGYEGRINKRAVWYTEHPQYRDPNLNSKKTVAAYDGLIARGLIYKTQRGYVNREMRKGSSTWFIATDDLLSLFLKIKENPFVVIKPNPDAQCIIIGDDVDGQKKQVEYLDTQAVTEMLNNPRLINRCLSKHYPDIRIKDDDRILRKKNGRPWQTSDWLNHADLV